MLETKHNDTFTETETKTEIKAEIKIERETDQDSKRFTNLEQSLRTNFVKKVFGIVGGQLLITFAMAYLSMVYKSIFYFQLNNPLLLTFSSIIAISVILAFSFAKSLSTNYPLNYLLLMVFTLCQSYFVAFYVNYFEENTVLMALFLTSTVVLSLSIYAMQTKRDIGYFGGLIIMGSCAALVALFGSLFLGITMLSSIISIMTALILGLYLIYDIKLLMGDDERKIDLDSYILGAIMIYMDIIEIFLQILKFFDNLGDVKDKNKNK